MRKKIDTAYPDYVTTDLNLEQLVERGMISEDDAKRIMAEKNSKKETEYAKEIERRLVDVHTAPIKKGTGRDKRWKTRVTKDDGSTKQIAKSELYDLERALYQHYYRTLPPSHDITDTIASLYPEYLRKQRARKRAESTIVRYEKDWRNHCSKAPFIHQSVADLTVDDLESWALSLIDDMQMGRTNYYNVTGIIRGILEIAVKKNLIRQNPWDYVDPGDLKKIDAKRKYERAANETKGVDTEVLTACEMQALKNLAWEDVKAVKCSVKNRFELLAVLFTLEQGLRVGELCALKHSDISSDGTTIHICRMLRDQGTGCRDIIPYAKGYKDRIIPLSDGSKEIIEFAHSLQEKMGLKSEYLFSQDQGPLKYRAPERALKILCRKLDIPPRHIHSIRKTVTTVLVDSGCYSPATIAKIMGNSVDVIYKFYYYNREDIGSICSSYDAAVSGLYTNKTTSNCLT